MGPEPPSLDDRLPDELGDIHHEIRAFAFQVGRGSNLAHTYAYDIVEPAVVIAVADVKDGADDLSSPRGVGATVSMALEHDGGLIISLDHRPEVWAERTRRTLPQREVRAAKPTIDSAFAMPVGQVEVLLP